MAINTKWAPMRNTLFVDRSELGADLRAVFSIYRGLIMIHLIHGDPKSNALAFEMAGPYD